MGVAIGIDSHKSSFAVAVVDEVGRPIGVREFTNDDHGHRWAMEWIEVQRPDRVVGIEGSGSYGAGLARAEREARESRWRDRPCRCRRTPCQCVSPPGR